MHPTLARLLLALVWLAFMAVTAWALWEVGYVGVLQAVWAGGSPTRQVFFDLAIACGFGCAWMVRDARSRGINPWPWALAILPLGSIPLLTYALVRDAIAAPDGGMDVA